MPVKKNIPFRTTVLNLTANVFLFILKFLVGIWSNSIAILSDSFNSLTDVMASMAIYISVKIQHKKADKEHPFGHHRAEPIAGLIVAIISGILAFEVLRESYLRLNQEPYHIRGILPISALLISIFTKLAMSIHFKRVGERIKSPAILATAVDSRNDVLSTLVALIGVGGAALGYGMFDGISGIIISFFIFWAGYKIGKENIDYLMGRAAPHELMQEVKKRAISVKGVKNLNDVRSHFVGNFIHIEIHIEVDGKLSTESSHSIGTQVKNKILELDSISEVFVHIDPAFD
ncbi:MAG: cation diffusion facilitator family transporter [Fidelibacterota bacterium]